MKRIHCLCTAALLLPATPPAIDNRRVEKPFSLALIERLVREVATSP